MLGWGVVPVPEGSLKECVRVTLEPDFEKRLGFQNIAIAEAGVGSRGV